MSPSDPYVFQVRSQVLLKKRQYAAAAKDLENAVALQSLDHLLWLRLGYARERARNLEGALAAYREAGRLAPFYAQPRWYVGNTLLRLEHADEAFAEIRRATYSNPALFSNAIELAWAASRSDAGEVRRWLQPQTPSERLALARFFARHGQPTESMAEWRAAGSLSSEQQDPLVEDLLSSKAYAEAFEVWWTTNRSHSRVDPRQSPNIINGGFEEPITLRMPGFGWRLASNTAALAISLDDDEPRVGSFSLRVDWNGASDHSTPIFSQLVLVEPKTQYQLSFASRTYELVTAGLPLITVSDADEKEVVLGQSRTLPNGTNGWQSNAVNFTAPSRAIRVSLTRDCKISPCAVFGHAWFDDFSLAKRPQ